MKTFVNKILSILGEDMVPDNMKDSYNFIPVIKKEDTVSEIKLLTKITNAITYLYGDKSRLSPNVIISALSNKKIYLSINVYDDKVNRYKKRILFRSTKDTAEEVLMDAVNWLVTQKKELTNPIDELKKLIKTDSSNIGDINDEVDLSDISNGMNYYWGGE